MTNLIGVGAAMFDLRLKDDHHDVKINSDVEIRLDSRIIMELISNLHHLSTSIDGGLKKLKCDRNGLTADYSFDTNDGRKWKQQLIFLQYPDSNPKQTFNVTDGFALNEFTPHRLIRDIVIRLLNDFGMVDIKIDVV